MDVYVGGTQRHSCHAIPTALHESSAKQQAHGSWPVSTAGIHQHQLFR